MNGEEERQSEVERLQKQLQAAKSLLEPLIDLALQMSHLEKGEIKTFTLGCYEYRIEKLF